MAGPPSARKFYTHSRKRWRDLVDCSKSIEKTLESETVEKRERRTEWVEGLVSAEKADNRKKEGKIRVRRQMSSYAERCVLSG